MVGIPIIDTGPMTVDEFYAFTDTRPDEERWELIDGQLVLNEPPYGIHQWLISNVLVALALKGRETKARWEVLPGFGVRVSNTDRPQPDLLVIPALHCVWSGERDITDVIAAIEIVSPSSKGRDLHWKRTAYTRLPSLTHYIAIVQDAVDVFVFSRDEDFVERRIRSLGEAIELRSLGISLPMAEIYCDTSLTA